MDFKLVGLSMQMEQRRQEQKGPCKTNFYPTPTPLPASSDRCRFSSSVSSAQVGQTRVFLRVTFFPRRREQEHLQYISNEASSTSISVTQGGLMMTRRARGLEWKRHTSTGKQNHQYQPNDLRDEKNRLVGKYHSTPNRVGIHVLGVGPRI